MVRPRRDLPACTECGTVLEVNGTCFYGHKQKPKPIAPNDAMQAPTEDRTCIVCGTPLAGKQRTVCGKSCENRRYKAGRAPRGCQSCQGDRLMIIDCHHCGSAHHCGPWPEICDWCDVCEALREKTFQEVLASTEGKPIGVGEALRIVERRMFTKAVLDTIADLPEATAR